MRMNLLATLMVAIVAGAAGQLAYSLVMALFR